MRSEQELKNIAFDLVKGKIFSDWQIEKEEDIPLIFQAIYMMTDSQLEELKNKDIGMLFEYKTAAYDIDNETGIPIFISFNILTKDESLKVLEWLEWFEKYNSMLNSEKG